MENSTTIDMAAQINAAIKHCIQMNSGVKDVFILSAYGEAVWPMKGYKKGNIKLTARGNLQDDGTYSITYGVKQKQGRRRIIDTEIGENLTKEKVADMVNLAIWGY